ncbi:TetR/AcrR family transcriptional regulator [Hahella aquimaris]|uniref:TetR/AcrR family transcriptional regulator n=1 Tax=Hahella sp. HNIBRBA332 TaxID=3015983 RepID=UPI00273CB0F9|nr:TetR/AcrR family transcriptional regulator [Hahella sp. HNIBRBA332]WLQ12125.1 TetR/AcrR family transcriptional regulator [Hahella sp. HNIBRBA332]
MRPQTGRIKLLQAAMTLFEANGYFATTIEQISQQAGVSKGLTYNYFKSKEELLIALVEDASNRMASVSSTLFEGRNASESVASFLNVFFTFLKTEKTYLKLQLTILHTPELRKIVDAAVKQRAEMLLKQVSRWMKDLGVEKSRNNARIILAMLDGVALHYLSIYDNYPLDAVQKQLTRNILDLCRQHKEE